MKKPAHSKNPIPKSDTELFREAIGEVRPLQFDGITPTRPSVPPFPRKTLPHRTIEETTVNVAKPLNPPLLGGDVLAFTKPGLQLKAMKRLRAGRYRPEAHVDLHGMTIKKASGALRRFLESAQLAQFKTVLVIHGKGKSGDSTTAPVLKSNVNLWLQKHHAVMAFCSARPEHGGTGAVYVLLKRDKKLRDARS